MDILLIKTDALLPKEKMKILHDNLVKQLESKVVVVPAYLHPEIINVPDGVEVLVETCNDREPEFLNKKFRFPKNQIDI